MLPGPVRDAREHPWVRAVAGYPAWERTDPELCAARDTLKDFSVSLAAHLSVAYETAAGSLREDPWHDGELAKRTRPTLQNVCGASAIVYRIRHRIRHTQVSPGPLRMPNC